MSDYEAFLQSKLVRAVPAGFEPSGWPGYWEALFPFQCDLVRWTCRRGRSALFADTGLGKTRMQLAWAEQVAQHTGGSVLILAPLAVAAQTVREGAAMGIDVEHLRTEEDVKALEKPIAVINYDRLHYVDPSCFAGVVIDESSCLKDFNSATRNALIAAFERTPFKLACTATPAPNDFVELGNHAEFLGVMSRTEMLSQWFVHDGGSTQDWRLKGHAVEAFWKWVASWAALVRRPSDLGYEDGAYQLPPLEVHEHVVAADLDTAHAAGKLFIEAARTLDEQRKARRASLGDRVARAAEIVAAEPEEAWLIWCELNDEANAITDAIPGAVQVSGSDTIESKENGAAWFCGQSQCACGSPSTPRAAARKRSKTPSTESGEESRALESQSATANTCANGSSETRSASESTERPLRTSETLAVESDTQTTKRTGRRSKKKSASAPQSESETSISGPTSASLLPNTIGSSNSRKEHAQSAVERGTSIQSEECTSTTAINPAPSEGFSAPPAISASESSETAPSASSAPRCTCGAASLTGSRRVLVSKPSIFGWGLNFQHCARVLFVGIGHSFESYYQAVRRCWRFGQKRPVHVHIVTSEAEGAVVANLRRKQADAQRMADEMRVHVAAHVRANVQATRRESNPYEPRKAMIVPAWLKEQAA